MERRNFIKKAGGLACSPWWPLGAVPVATNAAETSGKNLNPADEREPLHISIIGAGGVGVRLISQLEKCAYEGLSEGVRINYFGVDTDQRSLDGLDSTRVQPVLLPGGAGDTCVESFLARRIAREHREFLYGTGYGADCGALNLPKAAMVVVVMGFGRGVGIGLSQEIARQACGAGAFTAAFVTTSQSFDAFFGNMTEELRRLALAADIVVCGSDDESDPEAPANDVLTQCENELVKRVRNLVATIFVPDKGLVGIDLEDVRSLFYRTGVAVYSHGYGDSSPAAECAARTAVRKAIRKAIGAPGDIEEARGAMIIFSGNTDTLRLGHYRSGMREVRDLLGSNIPDFSIMGYTRWDDTMPNGRIGAELWIAGGGHA